MSKRDLKKLWERPLAEQLPERMRRRGVSYRELSLLTYEIAAREGDKGLSHAYLIDIAKARARPTAQTIELVAEALGFVPEAVPDYRLARFRRFLDQRHEPDALRRFLELEALLVETESRAEAATFVRKLFRTGRSAVRQD